MKKIILRVILILLIPVLAAFVLYLALAAYYKNGFSYGTWINGIYSTGKTIEEINQELIRTYEMPDLTVSFREKEGQETRRVLAMGDMECEISFLAPLTTIKESQIPLFWGKNLFQSNNKVILPERTFDFDTAYAKVTDFLEDYESAGGKKENGVRIIKTEQGYELEDTSKHILDAKKARQFILKAIAAGESEVRLEKSPCYYDLEITKEMKETYALWKKVDKFQDFTMTYQFGTETEAVDASVVCEWIALDETGTFVFDKEGELLLDEKKIEEYILSLASKYDTFNGTREFKATRGEVVTVEGGTYGNKLNQKKETAYLTDAYLNRKEDARIPEYEKLAKHQGSNDIGNTYIEIDMTQQKMYYYAKGELKIETPIVTGNMARRMDTPARTCFVYGKQKNRILRGPGYASHVNFWLPVNRGIGIHDAKWRKNFGGDIYKTEGSHGCINTPYDVMKELYDMVEIGTPVIMFY